MPRFIQLVRETKNTTEKVTLKICDLFASCTGLSVSYRFDCILKSRLNEKRKRKLTKKKNYAEIKTPLRKSTQNSRKNTKRKTNENEKQLKTKNNTKRKAP